MNRGAMRAGSMLLSLGLALGFATAAWGGEGTTGSEFLRLMPGARSAALGGAYAALGDDAETMFFNPAGMVGLLNPQVYVSHLAWWDQVSYDALWGVQPLGPEQAVGLSLAYLNVPPFNSTEDPEATAGTAWGLSAAGAYAQKITRSLALGGELNYVASRLGTAGTWGLAAHAGAKYFLYNDQLQLAAGLRNLGFQGALLDRRDALPVELQTSAMLEFWPDSPHRLALAAEVNVPFSGQPRVAAAAEGWLWSLLAVRAGVTTLADAGDWLSLGGGVHWQQFHLDYALVPLGLAGPVHRLSAGYDFGSQQHLARPQLRVRISRKDIMTPSGETQSEVNFMPEAQIPAGLDRWDVAIFTRAGEPVRRLEGKEPLPVMVVWDGKDASRRVVDREGYYFYRFRILDRKGYAAETSGEILPASITKLPQLKVLPRDLYAGQVTFQPKTGSPIQEWSVSIVNTQGELVKRYQGLGPLPKDFAWDGTDERRQQVSMKQGLQFVLQIKDQEGNEMKTASPLVQIEAGTKAHTAKDLPLVEQVVFHLALPPEAKLKGWALDVLDAENGKVVRTYAGAGRPPETVTWNARDDKGQAVASSRRYAYALRLQDPLGNVWQQTSQLEGTEVKVVAATDQEFKLKVEQILFDFNRAEIKPSMFEKLQKTADLARESPPDKIKLFIAGHTDEIGTDEYNFELSQKRADMVMRYLVEEEHVPSTAITTQGYGKTVPVVTGDDPQKRALNRRVEITIEIWK